MESAITLEVKFRHNVPGIIEERADHGSVDTDNTLQGPPNIQPAECGEGQLLNIGEERRMKMPQKK